MAVSEKPGESAAPGRLPLGRRAVAWRQRMLRDHPQTGPFILAMSDEPLDAGAFRDGAPEQRWVAEMLRRSFPFGIFLFNRWRGPGSAGRLHVVAVLPTGVWVIDIQRHPGAVVHLEGADLATGRADRLLLGDSDCAPLLADLRAQTAAVARALSDTGFSSVAPRGVMCLVDVEPGWRGCVSVGGSQVSKGRGVLRLLRSGDAVLDASDLASLGLALDRSLDVDR